jgi:predicted RND superfamily exporter protein
MWRGIAGYILRYRIAFVVILVLITAFMAWQGRKVEMSYEYAPLLPKDDSIFIENQIFSKKFGAGSDIIVIGVKDPDFFNLSNFERWNKMCRELGEVEGVEGMLSVANSYNINKNKEIRKFEFYPIFPENIETQNQLDSLAGILKKLPFYRGQLYNLKTNTFLLAITVDKARMATPAREKMVDEIEDVCESYSADTNIKVHYSGMPYIRVITSQKIKREFMLFTLAALLIVILILFTFFRSLKGVLFPVIVVSTGVIWTVGLMALLGYKITLLTGMIPPLLIVIGVPNCIFLVNKYHTEYIAHGNKIKALQRTIMKIGNATFLTNLTTASGFATFLITSSDILREFGLIASVNIMAVFITSLIIIPTAFSFLDPPNEKDTRHLKDSVVDKITGKLVHITLNHRKTVYIIFSSILIISIFGITMMKSTGFMVDDIPEDDPIYMDLKFFESNFDGLMPLEIAIDTKKPNGALRVSNLKKIETFSNKLSEYEELSPSLSLINMLKFSKQAFYNGKEKYYSLPNNREQSFILSYVDKSGGDIGDLKAFLDSAKQTARISYRVKDVGTTRMENLLSEIRNTISEIFPEDKYKVSVTGASVVFVKGTQYLVRSLFQSLSLAIFLIAVFMALMFNSRRMVLLALVPNIIPLLFTAGLMGFADIPIKASTILVFSIAFGISVDNTIHFLAKYRQELKITNWNIGQSVILALRETGVSMIYTSSVLFFGFGIFSFSGFGGTVALGILVSLTLLIALISNLVLLPSLLMWLQRRATTMYFKEPLLEIFDEEEDIEHDELRIVKISKKGTKWQMDN